MRVAHFLPSFPVPSQGFVLSQLTGLIDRGCAVDVFAHTPGAGANQHPDVRRYGLNERARFWAPASGRLRRVGRMLARSLADDWRRPVRLLGSLGSPVTREALGALLLDSEQPELRADGYDLFHCHFGNTATVPTLLRDALGLSAPVVTTFYGHDATRHPIARGPDCYRELFARGDHFLALSESMRARLVGLGCAPDRLTVHHLGVRCDEIEFRPRSLEPGDTLRLVCAARLVDKKGLEYAIRAVDLLRERKLDVSLNVVGEGPQRGRLQALIDGLELRDRVRLVGAVSPPEALQAIEAAHVLVCPSVTALDGDEEGTPTAILEAMASGAPVVATRHSGIPEQIEDGTSGLLVAERAPVELAERLEELAGNPVRWTSLTRAARRRVELQFDSGRQADTLLDLYRRLRRSC